LVKLPFGVGLVGKVFKKETKTFKKTFQVDWGISKLIPTKQKRTILG